MNWLAAHGYHLVAILLPIVIPLIIFQLLPLLVVIERRGAAFIQDRVGPNRAALHIQFKSLTGVFTGEQGSIIRLRGFGIPYTMTDLVKLLFKENFVPPFAYKSLYWLAPAIPVVTGLLTTALIPWFGPILHQSAGGGETLFGTLINTQMGLLLLFAFGSLTVYGVVLGSWSSNSKFSLLGGMRASAMMISYEVSMGLAVLGLLLVYQSFNLTDAVEWQAHRTWGILVQPVGFALFLVSMFAECNRNPFDVAEGESEIIAGFHTEYAGMKFMMYMTGEYLHVIVASALIATLYLGGYQPLPIPGLDSTWEKSHLGIFTAALLVPLVPLLFTAAALVRGRRLHYETLDAQDRDLRSKEYGVYAMLFGGAGAATIVAIDPAACCSSPPSLSGSGEDMVDAAVAGVGERRGRCRAVRRDHRQDHPGGVPVRVGALDAAALPLRPDHGPGVEGDAQHRPGQPAAHRHRGEAARRRGDVRHQRPAHARLLLHPLPAVVAPHGGRLRRPREGLRWPSKSPAPSSRYGSASTSGRSSAAWASPLATGSRA